MYLSSDCLKYATLACSTSVVILGLEALPSFAADIKYSEYTFDLIETQRVEITSYSNPYDPDDYFFEENVISLNSVIATGFLMFLDEEVLVPEFGNVLTPSIGTHLLGDEVLLFPGLGTQLQSALVSFVNGPNGPELVGVDTGTFDIAGTTFGALDGTTFTLTSSYDDYYYYEFTETTGFLEFNTINPSQLRVVSEPREVPEPLTILGSLAAIGLGTAMKKRTSN